MAQIIHLSENCKSNSDQARKVVRVFCAVRDIRLSKTEEQVMAYLISYGINACTKQDFLIGKLVANGDSLSSMLNKFKRLGLLEKGEDTGYSFPAPLQFKPQRMIGLKIKLDNV